MIKVMLVDDEPIFLRGFKNLIKWEEIDCAITQVAMNGEEALENLAHEKPDIIITDLIMPGMDGIELIKQVKSLEPSIEIIILSGHGEFEFAQQALENEVCGYLLKPVTRQQMSDEVCKAVAKIKKNRSFQAELELLQVQLKESIPLLKDKYLMEIIKSGLPDAGEHSSKQVLLGIDLSGASYFIALLQTDPGQALPAEDNGELIFQFSLCNFCNEFINRREKGFVVMDAGVLCLLVISMQNSFGDLEAYELINRLWEQIGRKYNINATFGMGKCCAGLEGVHGSYEGAVNALKSAFFMGKGQIIHANNILSISHGEGVYPQDRETSALEKIKYGGCTPDELADSLTDAFKIAAGSEIQVIYEYCHLFCIQLIRMLNSLNVPCDPSPEAINPLDIEKRIRGNHTIHELRKWLRDTIAHAAELIAKYRANKLHSIVYNAMKYIEGHLSEDLSLNAVAGLLYINPTYFSQLFKTQVGVNYFDYVTKMKMSKARELLYGKEYKVYEVAAMVGYKNVRSFGEAYKRFFGATPTE